jgi:hypothetical protein
LVVKEDLQLILSVRPASMLTAADADRVRGVFAENYREANAAYLDKSLHALGFVSMAETAAGQLAGFALGELRMVELPRLGPQPVRLAGLCCVSMPFRRHGLFGRLEEMAIGARRVPRAERVLSAGRMAHPASFRGMAANPSSVPRRGKTPTPWQQEVGIAVAEAYGVPAFDPKTFVVSGTGVPIGFPVIDIEASPEEWELFGPVDRSKGDSLLGIAWAPAPPAGWIEG